MSFHNPDSELSQLNLKAYTWVDVSYELFHILKLGFDLQNFAFFPFVTLLVIKL